MTHTIGTIIEVRPTYTITVTGGHLTRDQVPIARTGVSGGTVEINIVGEVRYVDLGAFINLGTVLADAEKVIVRASGDVLSTLHNEVARAIATERQFRAHDAESREVRRASLQRQIDAGLLPADHMEREVNL